MKSKVFFLPLISFFIVCCGQVNPTKQVDEGSVKGELYQSKEIGWSLEIPKNWQIMSKDKLEAEDQKGKDAIEKVYEGEINTKTLKHLISFQKNPFNIFASTSEIFKEDYPGEFGENNKALYQLLYNAYVNQGIKTDTSSGKEIIQGMEFYKFTTIVYAPDGKVILTQIMYSRLINGFDFAVNINYNNEQDKKTMMDAWKNSKFTNK